MPVWWMSVWGAVYAFWRAKAEHAYEALCCISKSLMMAMYSPTHSRVAASLYFSRGSMTKSGLPGQAVLFFPTEPRFFIHWVVLSSMQYGRLVLRMQRGLPWNLSFQDWLLDHYPAIVQLYKGFFLFCWWKAYLRSPYEYLCGLVRGLVVLRPTDLWERSTTFVFFLHALYDPWVFFLLRFWIWWVRVFPTSCISVFTSFCAPFV